jgi:hypothetical protein
MPFANSNNPQPTVQAPVTTDINNPPEDKAYQAFWKALKVDAKTGEELPSGLTPVRAWDFLMDKVEYTLIEFRFVNELGEVDQRKMAFLADDTRIKRMGELEFV